jgi:flavin reductase (DIM6/NTAB) family NADH-FMN oxidoreductase RutF
MWTKCTWLEIPRRRAAKVEPCRVSAVALSWLLEQLWAPVVAVTAAHEGRSNGLVSSTALTASLVPEAARVSVHLSKHSLTHEFVLGSAAFAIHLLPRDDSGLALFRLLGMTSGHSGPKLEGVPTLDGTTGSPLLAEAVAYLEARVVSTLDAEELTIVVGDVVASGGAADAEFLTIEDARERLPSEAMDEWARRFEAEVSAARHLRGLERS